MDLTYAPTSTDRPRTTPVGRWVGVLAVCLFGYALLGRTFAYVGLPPVFVGEVVLLVGLATALRAGAVLRALGSWTVLLWVALLAWSVLRAVPYVGAYGIDVARDLMLVGYGAYALVVMAVLLAEPDRLRELVAGYRTLAVWMLALAWLVYGIVKLAAGGLPSLPWAPGVGVLSAKGGDLMVHFTGVVAFLMLTQSRSAPAWAMAAFSAVVIMVSNRGGMVAFVLGLGVVWVLRPRGTGASRFVYAMAALIVFGIIAAPYVRVEVQGGSRDLSVEQIVENVRSIFGGSDSLALNGTVRWRMLWWGDIVDYTVNGPYFWTGKGYGVNLAISDGYTLQGDGEEETLRSPHNGHLTVLARSGVPGLALWGLVHLSWAVAVLRAWARARLGGDRRWVALFAWVVGLWVAALVNASFDVYLEGPMGGVWVWSVMGLGLAAARLQRTHPALLDDLPFGPPVAPTRAPAWGWSAPSASAAGPAHPPATRAERPRPAPQFHPAS